jgi:HSP20 family protein
MKEQGSRLKPMKRKIGEMRLADVDDIFRDMRETFDSIARRAYEIFEANGRQFGRDMENWFRAEHELLHPVHLEMRESNNEVTVQAEVPGFESKDIEISVEPGRLTIAGKREWSKEEKEEKLLYSERRSNRFFRCLNLPVEVDPEKASATLKEGVLVLKLPKTTTAKKIRIEPKAA